MITRVGFVLAATVVGWCLPVTGAADERGEAPPVLEPSRLLRIAAIAKPIVNGEPMLQVTLEPLDGGPRVTYFVPNLPGAQNENAFNPLPNPLPEVQGPVERLGMGAVVQVRIGPGEHGVALVGIKPQQYLDGSFRATGRGEYLLTCGGMSFQLHTSGRDRYTLVPRDGAHGDGYPGAALVARRNLRYELLLDAEQLKRLEEIRPTAIEIDEAAVGQAVGAVQTAAGREQRFEAEQELYELVQEHVARVQVEHDKQDQAVRKILTPDQYEVLSRSSRVRGGMFVIHR